MMDLSDNIPVLFHHNKYPAMVTRSVHTFAHVTYGNLHIDGLVQERRNSSALTMELRLSCTNPSIFSRPIQQEFTNIITTKLCLEIAHLKVLLPFAEATNVKQLYCGIFDLHWTSKY